MNVEDFRPCVCGHEKQEHSERIGCHARHEHTNGIRCGCQHFTPADEPFVDVPGRGFDWLGTLHLKDEHGDHDPFTRIRPSDIAFAHWKAQQGEGAV